MKKLFVFFTITILFCALPYVQAQERQLLRVTVPFSFTVENTTLPAGAYSVYLLNPYNLVRIQSADGRHVATVRGIPAERFSDPKKAALIFQRVADQYFLAEVRESDSKIERDLPIGKDAQQLAKNRNIQQVATVVTIPAR